MNDKEAHEKACTDTLELIKSWAEDKLPVSAALSGGLSMMLASVTDMAPSQRALVGMLALCMSEAYKNTEESKYEGEE